MKKIYTGDIKKLSIKKLDPKPGALINLAYESTVLKKDALFYINFLGVPISLDYNTKLLTREEAVYYLKNGFKVNPSLSHCLSCMYQDQNLTFSHEITKEEFKQLIKTKRAERKALRKRK
jgi:hypothetical protein